MKTIITITFSILGNYISTLVKIVKTRKNILIPIIFLLTFSCTETQAQTFSIQVNNIKRPYIIRLPQNYDTSQKLPLHIFLHGGGFTIEEAEATYGFTEHADTSGYIIAYPQGLNGGWDYANNFRFITALIDTLCENYKIDKQMIYVSGHSAGSELVNILACRLSHKIAAFGNVGGIMLFSDSFYYKPQQAIPYIQIHGTADNVIPYAGDGSIFSVDSVLSFWKLNNNSLLLNDSVEIPDKVVTDNSHVIKYTYGYDKSEIVFYKVVNGGHDAPDWKLNNAMGNTNRDINTPQVLWDFFKTHKLNGAKVTFITNSGFLIESGNKKVLIDALGVDPIPPKNIRDKILNGAAPFNSIDLVLLTHDHGDHFSAPFVANQLINNPTASLIGPKNVETLLLAQPENNTFNDRIIGITPGWNSQTDTSVNGIPVKIMRMHHDVATDIENNAYLFEIDSLKILHIGDYTGNVLSELNTFDLKNQNIDIAFINYYCYLDNQDTWKSVKEGLNAKNVIFYHIDNKDLGRMITASESLKNTTVFSSTFEGKYYNSDTSFFFNKAPILLNPIPDTTARMGQKFILKIENNTFRDDFDDYISYKANLSDGNELPDWLEFNANTKRFTGTPSIEETLQIKVFATDFTGAETSDIFKLTIELTSGLSEMKIKQGDFSVFPNPASQTIQIKGIDMLLNKANYQLINLNGKIIKQGKLDAETIEISELPKGIYVLSLHTNEGIINKKIVIE